MVRRGEVWWFEPPQERPRPYLILTRSQATQVLTRLVAVPCTGTIRAIPTEVRLGPDDGMPQECVATLDNLRLVERGYLTQRITALSSDCHGPGVPGPVVRNRVRLTPGRSGPVRLEAV